jgi:hypothetical protein
MYNGSHVAIREMYFNSRRMISLRKFESLRYTACLSNSQPESMLYRMSNEGTHSTSDVLPVHYSSTLKQCRVTSQP